VVTIHGTVPSGFRDESGSTGDAGSGLERGNRVMRISRSSPDSLGGDEALVLCILARVAAVIVGAAVLAQNGMGEGEPWMAIGAGVAFGVMAPGRWGAAIAGTAASSLAAMALLGPGAPAAALLVLPGAVVGSWLRPRVEAAQPVSWIDAMLIGAASEVALVPSIVLPVFPIFLGMVPLMMLSPLLGWAVGAALMTAACAWIHVPYGRVMHRMLPERFGGFALGQVLPITLLALTGGEPLVLLIVAARAFCLWWGHLLAEAEEVESEPPPRITVSPGRRRAETSWWGRG